MLLTVSSVNEPQRIRGQVARALQASCQVTYVTLPMGCRRPRRTAVFDAGGIRVVELAGPVLPLRVFGAQRNLWRQYQRRLARRLTALVGDVSGAQDVAVVFTPGYPELVAALPARRRVYFANDDFVLQALPGRQRQVVAQGQAETIRQCAEVVTVSEQIARRLREQDRRVTVMYPGHDCEPVRRPAGQRSTVLSLAYLGYVDWRIDFDLLRFLLESGSRVDLYGPVKGRAADVAELAGAFPQRFASSPPIPATEAPSLLAAHDVLIMPYCFPECGLAEAMEVPNKTFIYFAAGRPIVVSDMPNMKYQERGLVHVSQDKQAFLRNCQAVVAHDSEEVVARRLALAAANRWSVKDAELRRVLLGEP